MQRIPDGSIFSYMNWFYNQRRVSDVQGANQKFKFTYLMKIMLSKTDDEHPLTMPQIMEELEKYGSNIINGT